MRILLLGIEPDLAASLRSEVAARCPEASVETVDRSGIGSALGAGSDAVDSLVIGCGVEQRPGLASWVRRRDPRLAVVLLGEAREVPALADAVRRTPGMSRHARCLAADDAGLADEILRASSATARRRRLQRTLGNMTDRLQQSPAKVAAATLRPALDRLLDELPLGILVVDARRRVVATNRFADSLLRAPEGDLLGMRPEDRLPLAARQRLSDLLMTDDGDGRLDLELDGGRVVAARRARLESPAGEPVSVVVLEDVTERRRVDETLRRAARLEAVGRLAGGIAHHFNNLLTVILGHVGELHDADGSGRAAREIERAAERAADLTRQLLAFSERQFMFPVSLRLSEFVCEMLPLLERSVGDDVRVTTRLSAGERTVRVDRGLMEQVLVSLVFNARDAMPEGGALSLEVAGAGTEADAATDEDEASASVPAGFVRLTVRDTGVGMDETIREHLFEPFFTTKDIGQGSGLGLAAVHGIVHQHGGRVHVDSEPSRGTAVHVFLPAAS